MDQYMKIRNFFEDWMHLIVDPNDFTVGYQEEYISTIKIKQLDEQDNITYEMELYEAFPRNMNIMDLNHASSNQTHRLNILFAYRYWKDKGREFQTTPMDIPKIRRFPEVPVVDTRPIGSIGNPMGDLSGGFPDTGW
jgi:hypothetical protein